MTRAKKIFGFDDKWLIIIGIPVVTIITSVMMFSDVLLREPRFFFLACNGVGFIYTTVFWIVFRQVILFFAEKYPRPEEFSKRMWLQSLTVLVLFFAIKSVLDPLLHGYVEHEIADTLQHNISMTIGSLLVTFLVLTIYVSAGFYHQLQKTMVEKERLLKENVQSQLESLKNQVNPHFLFNSLNTLSYLIPEDPAKAENFVQKLSKAYRYILEIRERELTTLAEELGFLEAYNCLLSERFGDNLQIKINVPTEAKHLQILPLSLQMLFENAIKHNVVSTQDPLHIEVFVEKGDRLVVKNNLQPKKQELPSTRIGLENIKSRYRLIAKKEVEVIVTQQHFIVVLPLVQPEHVALAIA
jgi:two-component system, LytTR family, sensor kinase